MSKTISKISFSTPRKLGERAKIHIQDMILEIYDVCAKFIQEN